MYKYAGEECRPKPTMEQTPTTPDASSLASPHLWGRSLGYVVLSYLRGALPRWARRPALLLAPTYSTEAGMGAG